MTQIKNPEEKHAATRKSLTMNTIHLLSQTAFFRGISGESRRALARICQPVDARRRDVIFHEGKAGQAMFLLVRGHVQLHKTTPDGREIVIKVIKPGEAFAEVVLFEEPRYPVTATALTHSLLLRILRTDLHALLRNEDFRNDFITMLMRKQRYLADRIRQVTSHSVEERFFDFIREQYGAGPDITVTITKKEIAAAIGATPETLSRLIQKLKRTRALAWTGRKLRLNPAH